jgi:hypothetical protein
MSYHTRDPDFDWFGAGWAAFHFPVHPESFPPLDDRDAQRAWLAGFGAAWAECPDLTRRAHAAGAAGACGRTVTAALGAVLAGRTELHRQLALFVYSLSRGLASAPSPERRLGSPDASATWRRTGGDY